LAFGKAKNNKATKHVEACLKTSRDGGSNPPASSLRSELGIERRLPRHSVSEDGLIVELCKVLRATTRQASMKFYYVYILQSQSNPKRFYAGRRWVFQSFELSLGVSAAIKITF